MFALAALFVSASGAAAEGKEPLSVLEISVPNSAGQSAGNVSQEGQTSAPRIYYIELDDQPSITCFHQTMKVVWLDDEEGRQELQVERPATMRLLTAEEVAVPSLREDAQRRVTFNVKEPGVVRVSGMKPGTKVHAFSADGKSVATCVAGASGDAVVNLKSQMRGIYVISVDQSETFKIMKP